ncbi:MAG: DUF1501 domain-containing protein [Planctomycetia bacterium]|nr:DUF1501 domain-containing protein [Planctomycetia bacterium]
MTSSHGNSISRRDWLRLSVAGALGLSGSGWFGGLANRASGAAGQGRKIKSCILLWMGGGPSQLETFDMKPDGPEESRGELKPIATSVPGIQICEHLPKLAQQTGDLAILRSMSHNFPDHDRGPILMQTGFIRRPNLAHPHMGAVVSAEADDPERGLPAFVSVGTVPGPGFLSPRHGPMIMGDPTKGTEDFKLATDTQKFGQRVELLQAQEEEFHKHLPAQAVAAHRSAYLQATRLLNSNKLKAFDLAEEPVKVREAYGCNRPAPKGLGKRGSGEVKFGEGCLLARRLVEAGVPFVEVCHNRWDNHDYIFPSIQYHGAVIDDSMSALIVDLKERGLLDSTLIIWMGEMGRTPKFQRGGTNGGPTVGRDHFTAAYTAVLAGGGLKTGQVIGRTSKDGSAVEDRPISPPDFMATVYKALGIDFTKEYNARDGKPIEAARQGSQANGAQPVRLVEKGEKPVEELF